MIIKVVIVVITVALCSIIVFFGLYNKKLTHANRDEDNSISVKVQDSDKEMRINDTDINFYVDEDEDVEIGRIGQVRYITEQLQLPEVVLHDFFETDSQNVHDTFVQEDIKTINKNIVLPSDSVDISHDQVCSQIINEREDLQYIIKKIRDRNSYVGNVDKTELDVLRDVWISGMSNENIKNDLFLQIKECEGTGSGIYCPTGVVGRLTSSMMIETPENLPKSKAMYNQEVLAKFSKLSETNDDKNNVKSIILQDYDLEIREKISNLIDEWIDHV